MWPRLGQLFDVLEIRVFFLTTQDVSAACTRGASRADLHMGNLPFLLTWPFSGIYITRMGVYLVSKASFLAMRYGGVQVWLELVPVASPSPNGTIPC